MPTILNCVCPRDSTPQAIAKINANLVFLFELMSASFTGRQIGVIGGGTGCGCSEIQALAILNDNIIEFATAVAAGGGAPVDNSISSWAELAAVETTGLTVPVLKVWVNAADGTLKATQLRAGTDATDTANGIQRPDDYSDPGNAKVWYQV
jgi:hypothetical protein